MVQVPVFRSVGTGMLRRLLVAVLVLLVLAPAAPAADPPQGATWTEAWLDTPDGERLHADVLRPTGATDATKTPVILVVSPYLGNVAPDGNGTIPLVAGAAVRTNPRSTLAAFV